MQGTSLKVIKAAMTPSQKLALENEREWRKLIENLVALRITRKLSQKQVGELIGVSQSAISQFEDGSSAPNSQTIFHYALAVGAKLSLSVEASGRGPNEALLKHAAAASNTRNSKPGPRKQKAEALLTGY